MPDWIEHLRPRLAVLRLSPGRESEIIEELSQHLDLRYEELRAGGTSDAEACRLAIEELREPDVLAQHMRTLRQANVPPDDHTRSAPLASARQISGRICATQCECCGGSRASPLPPS